MKDRVIAVYLFALTLLLLIVHFPHHEGGKWEMDQCVVVHARALNNISLPNISRPHKNDSFSHPGDEASHELPPSEMEVLSAIGAMQEMRDFELKGWALTFAVVSIETSPDEIKGVYRAVAERPGKTRYAYRISQAQTRSPAAFLIVVEAPLPIATCADGTEPTSNHCDDGSNPK